MIYNTTTNTYNVYNGTSWTGLASGGTGTWEDVTASRTNNTVYQNTSGKTRWLMIRGIHNAGVATLHIGSTSSPGEIGRFEDTGSGTTRSTFFSRVPNNWYYKVSFSNFPEQWSELDD
jgi:hypothetical protein